MNILLEYNIKNKNSRIIYGNQNNLNSIISLTWGRKIEEKEEAEVNYIF